MKPIAYVRPLKSETCAMHVVTFCDGKPYVVKCYCERAPKALINEWVAYYIGKYMGVPIPPSMCVRVPFLSDARTQWASEYIDGKNGCELTLPIANRAQLAALIVFDYWLSNGARTRNDMLCERTDDNELRIWAIDHTKICGSSAWTVADLRQLPRTIVDSAAHRLLVSHVSSEEMKEAVRCMQTMPTQLLEEIVALIPEDWPFAEEEKKQLVHALVYRRDRVVPRLMQRFCERNFGLT